MIILIPQVGYLFFVNMSLLKVIVAGITLAATVCGIISLGYEVGKDTEDAFEKVLQTDKTKADQKIQNDEAEITQLRAENTAIKIQLQNAQSPSMQHIPVAFQANAVNASHATADLTTNSNSTNQSREVKLTAGQSVDLDNGHLILALVGIEFSVNPSPPRNYVNASVGAIGKPNKNLTNWNVGSYVIFNGYDVRLKSVDPISVTFQITALSAKSAH